MSTATAQELKVGTKAVRLSNPHKVLYPKAGFTKSDIVDYYRNIAPILLKHLKNRPLTLKRYPNGVDSQFFYEKNCPSHKPPWVKTAEFVGTEGTTNFCLVDGEATLIWVANLASIELHTMLSRAPKLDRPTMMVFDLDPGAPANLLDCLPLGVQLRDMLDHLGLRSFAKTSGSKGLHIFVPLNTAVTFDQTKQFAHSVAITLERSDPKRITSVMRKDLRGGKIFVDWSQNDTHKTTVCAYSLRAQPRPTVSTPVTWEEIAKAMKRNDEKLLKFEAAQVLKRIEKQGDVFAPVLELKQRLPKIE